MDTFLRLFGSFRDFLDTPGREARGDYFETLWGFRARRAWSLKYCFEFWVVSGSVGPSAPPKGEGSSWPTKSFLKPGQGAKDRDERNAQESLEEQCNSMQALLLARLQQKIRSQKRSTKPKNRTNSTKEFSEQFEGVTGRFSQ